MQARQTTRWMGYSQKTIDSRLRHVSSLLSSLLGRAVRVSNQDLENTSEALTQRRRELQRLERGLLFYAHPMALLSHAWCRRWRPSSHRAAPGDERGIGFLLHTEMCQHRRPFKCPLGILPPPPSPAPHRLPAHHRTSAPAHPSPPSPLTLSPPPSPSSRPHTRAPPPPPVAQVGSYCVSDGSGSSFPGSIGTCMPSRADWITSISPLCLVGKVGPVLSLWWFLLHLLCRFGPP